MITPTPRHKFRLQASVAIIICLFVSTLVGCGFQLRQSFSLASVVPALDIDCKGNSWRLCQRLKNQLEIQGIEILDTAPVSLVINAPKQKTRSISLTSDASVAEYNLTHTARYQLISNNNELVIRDQEVSASRQYEHDNKALLSQENQTDELKLSLQKQLADIIFNQLSLISSEEMTTALQAEGE